MYSSEIETFLQERNYVVNPEECNILMDINQNPQIDHMQYFSGDNRYVIFTNDNYCFKFWVKPD